MTLDYIALAILIAVGLTIFYAIIAVHDIPYEIAKRRNHPHKDAINAAGWVSIFTLHALWPFLWIWALSYDPARGWGLRQADPEVVALRNRVSRLEAQLNVKE